MAKMSKLITELETRKTVVNKEGYAVNVNTSEPKKSNVVTPDGLQIFYTGDNFEYWILFEAMVEVAEDHIALNNGMLQIILHIAKSYNNSAVRCINNDDLNASSFVCPHCEAEQPQKEKDRMWVDLCGYNVPFIKHDDNCIMTTLESVYRILMK